MHMVAKLREFLLRGGFFMCDDFHGTDEWNVFIDSMKKVFPDRPIVDLENSNPIFHTIFDLDDRYQVPGDQFVYTGRIYEKDGYEPRWRGIYDDKGRLMVAICHNMDLGDSWETRRQPQVPGKVLGFGHPDRRKLHHVRHDPLSLFAIPESALRLQASIVVEVENVKENEDRSSSHCTGRDVHVLRAASGSGQSSFWRVPWGSLRLSGVPLSLRYAIPLRLSALCRPVSLWVRSWTRIRLRLWRLRWWALERTSLGWRACSVSTRISEGPC